jgi:hypothetical protein
MLAVIPSVKVIKMTMELKCHDVCCGKISEEVPNSCQKEKCLVNLHFHSGPFLVFDTDYKLQDAFLVFSPKEDTLHNNTLIPNFSVVIWQPPEYLLNAEKSSLKSNQA